MKKKVTMLLGITPKWYRFVYSIFSTVGILVLLVLNQSIKGKPFFENSTWVLAIGIFLGCLGLIIISLAFREYKFSAFVGLKDESEEFKRKGILAKVRHPIYSGTILIIFSVLLINPTPPTLLSATCMLLYLPIGVYLEERKLLLIFGEAYKAYKREVPSIIPRLK
jgi:protein-S-isoprenylcysteine O-methyltransferase Ste14